MRCSGCRCRCPESLCGVDVDDLFAYTTTKQIKIRDARLGLIHYLLLFCICLYIVVYQLIAKNGYLKFTPPQSSVRLTLQEPTKGCNPNKATCQDSFTPLSHLPYCCAQNSSCRATKGGAACSCDFRPRFDNYNCTWMGGNEAGIVRESSILIATLVHQYNETRNSTCFRGDASSGSETCNKVWLIGSDMLFFTADVESFTVLIDHSVVSPGNGLSIAARNIKGRLYVDSQTERQQQLCASSGNATSDPYGNHGTRAAPCYLAPDDTVDNLDVFSVGTLLQAMGVSLEDRSYDGSDHSVRYDGMIAEMEIQYANTRPWRGLADTRYVYKLSVIPQSTYKTSVVTSGDSDMSRRKSDVHGILFEVRPGGDLAVFDITSLLVQLTTSLTLLALATVGVNMLAQYILRYRHYYGEALCERTVDLRRMADSHRLAYLEEQPEDVVDEELRRRRLSRAGSRYAKIMRLLDYGYRTEQSQASLPLSNSASMISEAVGHGMEHEAAGHGGSGTGRMAEGLDVPMMKAGPN